MNNEPAAAVKTFGDQFDADGSAGLPTTKPPAGNVVPSEQVAHAAFCAPSDSAAVDASKVRCHLPWGLDPNLLPPRVGVSTIPCDVFITISKQSNTQHARPTYITL